MHNFHDVTTANIVAGAEHGCHLGIFTIKDIGAPPSTPTASSAHPPATTSPSFLGTSQSWPVTTKKSTPLHTQHPQVSNSTNAPPITYIYLHPWKSGTQTTPPHNLLQSIFSLSSSEMQPMPPSPIHPTAKSCGRLILSFSYPLIIQDSLPVAYTGNTIS